MSPETVEARSGPNAVRACVGACFVYKDETARREAIRLGRRLFLLCPFGEIDGRNGTSARSAVFAVGTRRVA